MTRCNLCRLSTRDQLLIRRIIVNDKDKCCVLCFKEDELRNHLFCRCDFSKRLWADLVKCLGAESDLSADEFCMFMSNHLKMKNEKICRIMSVIWLTRNAFILKRDIPNFEECKLNIKTKAWKWLMVASNFKSSCSFFDWFNVSLYCFN